MVFSLTFCCVRESEREREREREEEEKEKEKDRDRTNRVVTMVASSAHRLWYSKWGEGFSLDLDLDSDSWFY